MIALRPEERLRHTGQLVEDEAHAVLEMRLQPTCVESGCHMANALIEYGLEEHRRRSRTVSLLVLQLPQKIAHEHGADIGVDGRESG